MGGRAGLIEATLLQMLHRGVAAICCFLVGRMLEHVLGGVDFLRANLATNPFPLEIVILGRHGRRIIMAS